jgi:hypothetical protein
MSNKSTSYFQEKLKQLREWAELGHVNTPLEEMELKVAEDILHELQVHQIEIEMQNEQLRRTLIDLEESRDRYENLYDFSPIGYITLSSLGRIRGINLTGTEQANEGLEISCM